MAGIRTEPHLKNLYRTKFFSKSRIGCLRLDMNESVAGLPEDFVKKVLRKIDAEFLATYPEYDNLLEKIARHNNLKPENICLSNGSDAAIKYIFDVYISSRDKVLIPEPSFAMYPVYCKIFNAQPILIPYKEDLSFPKEMFMHRISRDIRMAVLVNPNNPTGTVLKQQEIVEIIKRAQQNKVLVLVDEAYFYFYPKTVINEIKNFKNLIVLRTFSKLCGMASFRLGYAAACPDIIEHLKKVKPSYDVNGLVALLAEEFLDKPSIIKDLIEEVNGGKTFLIKKLSDEGIEFRETYANFVLIKCCKRAGEIVKRLAKKNILVQGEFKQNILKDYIRVTLGKKIYMEKFWKAFIKIW